MNPAGQKPRALPNVRPHGLLAVVAVSGAVWAAAIAVLLRLA